MFVNKQGVIVKQIPENGFVPFNSEYQFEKKYRVRVIHNSFGRKTVIHEEDFETQPESVQIMYCIAKASTLHSLQYCVLFASVEEIYMLTEQELPF